MIATEAWNLRPGLCSQFAVFTLLWITGAPSMRGRIPSTTIAATLVYSDMCLRISDNLRYSFESGTKNHNLDSSPDCSAGRDYYSHHSLRTHV
jgi:hypothetical protein